MRAIDLVEVAEKQSRSRKRDAPLAWALFAVIAAEYAGLGYLVYYLL